MADKKLDFECGCGNNIFKVKSNLGKVLKSGKNYYYIKSTDLKCTKCGEKQTIFNG